MNKVEKVEEAIRQNGRERGYIVPERIIKHLVFAAIAAMREPTEEMIEALMKAYPDHAVECYKTMIDAALKE